MSISIRSETDRLPAAVDFAKKKIEELTMDINGCDYIEDVNGKPVYAPGSYADEKRGLENEKRNWEIMLEILTTQTPVTLLDW